MDGNLKKLKQCELYIAKEIKRICSENDIHYSMMGGTLIGAIRHKGFIPWDDDIDFAMSREDYDRFILACSTSLSLEFELQNWETDDFFSYSYSKVLLKGTVAVEHGKEMAKCKREIFVDIFPFDRIPDSKIKRYIHSIPCYYYKKLAWLKDNYDELKLFTGIKYIFFFMLYKRAQNFEKKEIVQKFEKATKKYNHTSTKSYSSICGAYGYFKEIVPNSFFETFIEVPFEDTTFMAVASYDFYLRQVFGDYMQLPPEDQRRTHSMVEVDFGDFFERHPEL